jgi:serine phosphatase RsbU (regulator of sigma subunit)
MFLTTFTTRINVENKMLCYAGSSHPALLLWKGKFNKIKKLSSQNAIIGFERQASNKFIQEQIQLESSDKLFLYTDGIIEAENEKSQSLGIHGFTEIINHFIAYPAKAIVELIIKDVHEKNFTQVKDDIYLIAVDIF